MKSTLFKPTHGGHPGSTSSAGNFRFKTMIEIIMNQRDWEHFCNSWIGVFCNPPVNGMYSPAFLQYFESVCQQYQNPSVSGIQRHLMAQLNRWRETNDPRFAIPGYETPPKNAVGYDHPQGWSVRNLARFKPTDKELAEIKRGHSTAS